MPPAGYAFTGSNAGSNDALDSDIDPTTGRSQTVTLVVGQVYSDLDAGLYQPASIGDFVWKDSNADGIQDAGEPGLAGVIVYLLDGNGNIIATDTTDAAGAYGFDNLAPGDYSVQFILPNGYVFSPDREGSNTGSDSDPDPATGISRPVTLSSGDAVTHVDAGMYQYVSLGDFVWQDLNANGIQDTGEPGLAGVVMVLLDDQGNVVATDTTDQQGAYHFDNLDPGTWQVVVQPPSGYIPSTANAGTDNQDSDFDQTTHTSPAVTLSSGQSDNSIDAGFVPGASIGDYVWDDVNRNGVQEGFEGGISGVIVYLQDNLGNILAADTTDANGYYLFDELSAGSYTIRFVTPPGFTPTRGFGTPDEAGTVIRFSTEPRCHLTLPWANITQRLTPASSRTLTWL
ncbi:MAG: SdrD B-like domain-containing protein [Bacteroidia bacterium]